MASVILVLHTVIYLINIWNQKFLFCFHFNFSSCFGKIVVCVFFLSSFSLLFILVLRLNEKLNLKVNEK